jgi:subtilisin-like proprotein convertase family protein
MKRILLSLLVLAALSVPSRAGFMSYSGATLPNNGVVPDNNLSGWASTLNVSSSDLVGAGGVQVALNISGGWNGDLYGYLQHDSGMVVLLNQVGSNSDHPGGFNNNGFSVTLIDGSGNLSVLPIYTVGSYAPTTPAPLTGTYSSQGGTLNTTFNGSSVGGQWTLFLADKSAGDISQVTGWSLNIDAVPEPTTWALMIFGVSFGGWRCWTWRAKRA